MLIPAGRERFLTEAEFGRLYAEADKVAKPWLVLALYTGMRPTELSAMKWDDIDFGLREFIIRQSKSGISRRVYIYDSAWQMVQELGPSVGSTLLLRTWKNDKDEWGRPEHYLQKGFRAAGIADAYYCDLRRTFATWLREAGVDPTAVGEPLGHKVKGTTITTIYARLTSTQRKRAVEVLPTLEKIIQGITQRGNELMGKEAWTS